MKKHGTENRLILDQVDVIKHVFEVEKNPISASISSLKPNFLYKTDEFWTKYRWKYQVEVIEHVFEV